MSLGLKLDLGLGFGGDYIRCWLPLFGQSPATYMEIPRWSPSLGSTIKFSIEFQVDTGNRYQLVLSDSSSSASWFGLEYDRFTYDGTAYSELKVDGLVVTSGSVNAVYGQTYEIELTTTSSCNVGIFGNGYATGADTSWYYFGSLGGIVLTDASVGVNSRRYDMVARSKKTPTSVNIPEASNPANDGTLMQPDATTPWISVPCAVAKEATYASEYTSEYA